MAEASICQVRDLSLDSIYATVPDAKISVVSLRLFLNSLQRNYVNKKKSARTRNTLSLR